MITIYDLQPINLKKLLSCIFDSIIRDSRFSALERKLDCFIKSTRRNLIIRLYGDGS